MLYSSLFHLQLSLFSNYGNAQDLLSDIKNILWQITTEV